MARRILITGGSSGLGLALARRLAARGDAVALLARNEARLAAAAAGIRADVPGAQVLHASCDVQDEEALGHAVAAIDTALGGIDVLVNSAGILREGYFERIPPAVHREVMATNYFGTLNAIHSVLPSLRRSAQGRIVNIASIAGLTGVFGYTAYCASKHALVGFTESLRYELAPQGITVQLVCPGEFDSPMVDEMERDRTPENRAHTQTIPKTGVAPIVEAVLRGLDGRAFRIIPGLQARLTVFGLQHFPATSRAVGDARVRGVYVGPR